MSQAGEKMSQSSKKGATKSDKLVKNCHKIVKKKKLKKATKYWKNWKSHKLVKRVAN